MNASAVDVGHFVKAGAGTAGVEQNLVQEREATGGDGVEIHAAEGGGVPAAEAAGGVAEGDAGGQADEGGGKAADDEAVAGPVFDERMAFAVAGADGDIGVGEGGEKLGKDGGIVGEVGIHGDDGIGAGAESELDAGAHGVAVTAGMRAFEDVDVGELAGDGGGAIGTGIIDDQDAMDGSPGGGDSGHKRRQVVPFIVGRYNNPHVLQQLHTSG